MAISDPQQADFYEEVPAAYYMLKDSDGNYYCIRDTKTHFMKHKRVNSQYKVLNVEETDSNIIHCIRIIDDVTGTFNKTTEVFTPDEISQTPNYIEEESIYWDKDFDKVTTDYKAFNVSEEEYMEALMSSGGSGHHEGIIDDDLGDLLG